MSGTITAPVTVSKFRTDFPEFADVTKYPTNGIQMYLNIANSSHDPIRWGQYWVMGVELYTAHFVALDALDVQSGSAGGVAGTSSGIVSSKSIGGVSVSYDVATGSEKDAGHWNLTNYGKRYFRFARIVGAGPVHVGPRGPGVVGTVWR